MSLELNNNYFPALNGTFQQIEDAVNVVQEAEISFSSADLLNSFLSETIIPAPADGSYITDLVLDFEFTEGTTTYVATGADIIIGDSEGTIATATKAMFTYGFNNVLFNQVMSPTGVRYAASGSDLGIYIRLSSGTPIVSTVDGANGTLVVKARYRVATMS